MDNQKRIITIATPKGGTGKSTLVETLAVEAAYQGLKVLIFDCDNIGSTTNFIIRRNELIQDLIDNGEEPIPEITQVSKSPDVKDPRRAILAFADDYDLILIDNRGGAEFEFQCTAMIADIVLHPVSSSDKEVEQLPRFIESIKKVNQDMLIVDPESDGIDVRVVLNKVSHHCRSEYSALRDVIRTDYRPYLSLSSSEYPDKKIFTKTGHGLTVSDRKMPERACVQLLLDEIFDKRPVASKRDPSLLEG